MNYNNVVWSQRGSLVIHVIMAVWFFFGYFDISNGVDGDDYREVDMMEIAVLFSVSLWLGVIAAWKFLFNKPGSNIYKTLIYFPFLAFLSTITSGLIISFIFVFMFGL